VSSSSPQYESGAFIDTLKKCAAQLSGHNGHHAAPHCAKERAATYSPILPISKDWSCASGAGWKSSMQAGLIRFDDGSDTCGRSLCWAEG
jgi:hypothetical protein